MNEWSLALRREVRSGVPLGAMDSPQNLSQCLRRKAELVPAETPGLAQVDTQAQTQDDSQGGPQARTQELAP